MKTAKGTDHQRRDNENNRWKKNAKNKKKKSKQRQKGERGAEAIVKGWELNDFVLHLS